MVVSVLHSVEKCKKSMSVMWIKISKYLNVCSNFSMKKEDVFSLPVVPISPNYNMRSYEGCFIWQVEILNGCSSVMVNIWHNVGKAKMCLRGGRFFQFSKICLHFSAVCLQFFKKSATSQTHFGFTNIGSNMNRYRATAIWNFHVSNETPCSVSNLA